MAENKVLLNVEVQATQALKELAELKKQAEELKKKQQELDTSTDEGKQSYLEYAEQIKAVNKEAQNRSKVIQNQITQNNKAADSLNGMAARLAELKNQYREMSKSERESPFGQNTLKEMSALTEQLKEAEAEYGTFTRNVGNYEGAIAKIFPQFEALNKTLGTLGVSLNDLPNKGFKDFTQGLAGAGKAVVKFGVQLMATPLGWIAAAVAGVVGAIKLLSDQFAKNDTAGTQWAKMLATFRPIIDGIKTGINAVVEVIGNAAEAVANFFGGISSEAKAAQDLVIATDNLQEAERQYTESSAKNQMEIERLKTESRNREKYDFNERLAMLQKANELERQNAEERKKIAEEKVRIMEEEARRNKDTSDATMDAIAQARAEMYNAEKDYYTRVRKLGEQERTFKNEEATRIKNDAAAARKAEEDALKAAEEAAKKRHDILQKELDFEKEIEDIYSDFQATNIEDNFYAQQEWNKKEFERQEAFEKEKIELQKQYGQISEDEYNKAMQKRAAARDAFEAQQIADAEKYYAEVMDAAKTMLEATQESEIAQLEEKYAKQVAVLQEAGDSIAGEYEKLKEKQQSTLLAGDVWLGFGEAMTAEEMKRLQELEKALMENAALQKQITEQGEKEKAAIKKKYDDAEKERQIKAIDDAYALDLAKAHGNDAEKFAITQKYMQDRMKLMKTLYGEESKEYIDAVNAMTDASVASMEQLMTEAQKKTQQNAKNFADGLSQYGGAAMEIFGTIDQMISDQENAQMERYTAQNDKKKEMLQSRLDDGLISQEDYDAQVMALDEEQAQKEKELQLKQAKRQKAMAIMNATLNAANAISMSLAQAPVAIGPIPNPAGIASLALATTMGALQLAAAIATPLPQAAKGGIAGGGLLVGPSHAEGGIPIEAEGGEAIINKRSTAKYRGLLSAINADGGGARFAQGGIVPNAANIPDGGYTIRHAEAPTSTPATAKEIANEIAKLKIYVSVKDINDGQDKYAQLQANKTF